MNKKKTAKRQEEAFRNAAVTVQFQGMKLEPFSFLRQTTLMSLLNEMGATYAAEVALAIFVMSQPDDELKEIRRSPERSIDRADRFCDENGLGVAQAGFKEARSIYEGIKRDMATAAAIPNIEGAEEDDPDDPN